MNIRVTQSARILVHTRTSRTTPTVAVPIDRTIRVMVAMSQRSHGEPGAPPGLAFKNLGASFAIAPHQTAVAPTMTTIATATAAASAASAVRIAVGSFTRLATATATTVHNVKVMAMSAAHIKNNAPYQWKLP
jgi:hypothetical protein